MSDVVGPIGDDMRLGVGGKIAGEIVPRPDPVEPVVESGRHAVQIRHDMALDPGMERRGQRQDDVELMVAIFRGEREADQLPVEAVELGVEEIAHHSSP
jgi:hypothetical protein